MAKSKNTILASLLTAAGDIAVSGSGSLTGDLTVQGRLTAQEYHSEIVSSSILYTSGSTKFGDSADDTHQFTGSVNISGSILVNGVAAVGPQGATGSQGAAGSNGAQGASVQFTTTSAFSWNSGISVGSITNITVDTGLSYVVNQSIVLTSQADSAIFFFARVRTYNSGTGALSIATTSNGTLGSGTAWNINLSGAVGAQGAQGVQGVTGFQGATGIQGSIGAQGNQGPIGPQGTTGAQGNQGPTGQQGNQGPTGPQGATGIQGTTGAQGNQGPTGAQGNQGPAGPGVSGTQGYLSKFTSSSTIGDSIVQDLSTYISVGGYAQFNRGTLSFTLNPSYGGGNVYTQLQSTGALALATGGDSNKIYIDTSGDIGIGTTSPATSLHIVRSTNVGLRLNATASNGSAELDLLSHGTQNAFIDYGPNQLRFRSTNSDMSAITSGSVLVLQNDGNVGIGTTSPARTLHVMGQAAFDMTTVGIVIQEQSSTAQIVSYKQTGGTYADLHLRGANLGIAIDGTNGNVGVGTASPGYRLDVAGVINSNSSGTGTLNLGFTGGSSRIAGRITGAASPSYNSTGKIGFSVTTWGADTDYGLTEVMAIDMRNADNKNPVIWMNPFGGNVGMGTTTPSSTLHVRGLFGAPSTSGSTQNGIARFGQTAGNGVLDIGFGDPYSWLQSRNTTDYSTNYNLSLQPNGGNVGIGTTDPSQALTINRSSGANSVIYLTTDTGQAGVRLLAGTGATNRATRIDFLNGVASGTTPRWTLLNDYNQNGTNDFRFINSDTSTSVLTLLQNGNVGIGTTSPLERLDVRGSILINQDAALRAGLSQHWIIGQDSGTNVIHIGSTGVANDIRFDSSTGSGIVMIKTNGNVGIGTTSPLGELHIVNASGTGQPVLELQQQNAGSNILQWRGSAGSYLGIISNDGNVGINTTSPAERLHVVGNIQLGSTSNQYIRYRTQSAWDYYLKADFDDFVIYDSQSTEFFRAIYNGGGTAKYAQFLNSLRAHNNSNVTVLGTLTENSSIRYKENVKTIEYGLDKVLQMRGVSYTKKDTGLKELGLIAEEVYEILPDVVLKNNEGEPDSVSYGRITAVLIEAIKDLQQQINVLNSK